VVVAGRRCRWDQRILPTHRTGSFRCTPPSLFDVELYLVHRHVGPTSTIHRDVVLQARRVSCRGFSARQNWAASEAIVAGSRDAANHQRKTAVVALCKISIDVIRSAVEQRVLLVGDTASTGPGCRPPLAHNAGDGRPFTRRQGCSISRPAWIGLVINSLLASAFSMMCGKSRRQLSIEPCTLSSA